MAALLREICRGQPVLVRIQLIPIFRSCLESGNINDQLFNVSLQGVGRLILADDAI